MPSKHYYLISNRAYDPSTGEFSSTVATDGALTFLLAPAANPTRFTVVPDADWLAAVQNDLAGCSVVQPPVGPPVFVPARAALFVHGYGVPFTSVVQVFPTYFSNLSGAQGGGFEGVLIGFDWPSDDLGGTLHQARGFQEAKAKARETGERSFPRLLQVLRAIRTSALPVPPALTAICHSMGNYVMFAGAPAFAPATGERPLFDQILCVAAMLESNGFDDPNSRTYGSDIVAAAARTTIYFSSHDDVLPLAELPGYDHYKELGIHGPRYGSTLLPRVVGVDCSAVVDRANAERYEPGSGRILAHTSYFYIPEVLQDIVGTLVGVPADRSGDRTAVPASGEAGYAMKAAGPAT